MSSGLFRDRQSFGAGVGRWYFLLLWWNMILDGKLQWPCEVLSVISPVPSLLFFVPCQRIDPAANSFFHLLFLEMTPVLTAPVTCLMFQQAFAGIEVVQRRDHAILEWFSCECFRRFVWVNSHGNYQGEELLQFETELCWTDYLVVTLFCAST